MSLLSDTFPTRVGLVGKEEGSLYPGDSGHLRLAKRPREEEGPEDSLPPMPVPGRTVALNLSAPGTSFMEGGRKFPE